MPVAGLGHWVPTVALSWRGGGTWRHGRHLTVHGIAPIPPMQTCIEFAVTGVLMPCHAMPRAAQIRAEQHRVRLVAWLQDAELLDHAVTMACCL